MVCGHTPAYRLARVTTSACVTLTAYRLAFTHARRRACVLSYAALRACIASFASGWAHRSGCNSSARRRNALSSSRLLAVLSSLTPLRRLMPRAAKGFDSACWSTCGERGGWRRDEHLHAGGARARVRIRFGVLEYLDCSGRECLNHVGHRREVLRRHNGRLGAACKRSRLLKRAAGGALVTLPQCPSRCL